MSDYHSRGLIRAPHAILKAAKVWHGQAFEEIEAKAASVVHGHGPPTIGRCIAFGMYRNLILNVINRLRNLLECEQLTAFHFFNRQFDGELLPVPRNYWTTPESLTLLKRVFFEGLEIQSSRSQPSPRDTLYFRVAELADTLDPAVTEKRRLTFLKKPLDQDTRRQIGDALRSLAERHPELHRPDQFKAIRVEFQPYRISDRDLRCAAREAPLRPGRPRKRQ